MSETQSLYLPPKSTVISNAAIGRAVFQRQTPQTAQPLHKVHLVIDSGDIERSAKRQGLTTASDLGYVLHGHLRALFGDLAPTTFHRFHTRDSFRSAAGLEVIGYGPVDAETLRRHAELYADPLVLRSLTQLAAQPIPSRWPTEQRFGFQSRICPVKRRSSKKSEHRAGSEVDAYLWAQENQVIDPRLSTAQARLAAYLAWMQERCDGIIRLERVQMIRYDLVELPVRTRRPQRQTRCVKRPAVQLRGDFEILAPDAFNKLLARGVGRHRAFGFGMFRILPPQQVG